MPHAAESTRRGRPPAAAAGPPLVIIARQQISHLSHIHPAALHRAARSGRAAHARARRPKPSQNPPKTLPKTPPKKQKWRASRCNPTNISLKAGCELFLCYTTRTSALELEDFAAARARLIERGNQFAETSTKARAAIAEAGARFIPGGAVVLVHGYSRVVLALLRRVQASANNFSVVVTEGRPDGTGVSMAKALAEMGIPATLILDAAVAYVMGRCVVPPPYFLPHALPLPRGSGGRERWAACSASARFPPSGAPRPSSVPHIPHTPTPRPPKRRSVDMVLVGAEGVVENGGVINKLGTYTIAVCAKAHNRPFYVAAESYKFARLYPLNQRDLPMEAKPLDLGPLLPARVGVDNPSRDYTPPAYIDLLITDLGILTPAAVSDELIQLYV